MWGGRGLLCACNEQWGGRESNAGSAGLYVPDGSTSTPLPCIWDDRCRYNLADDMFLPGDLSTWLAWLPHSMAVSKKSDLLRANWLIPE